MVESHPSTHSKPAGAFFTIYVSAFVLKPYGQHSRQQIIHDSNILV